MSELKPCPFCGAQPEITKGYEGVETICCPGCGIVSDGHYPTDEHRKAAFAKWNTRATMPDDRPRVLGCFCKKMEKAKFGLI